MKKLSPDMNDEELDLLFREAAEQYQPLNDGTGWEKLKPRLSEIAGSYEGRRRGRRVWLLLLAAIGIGTMIWWAMDRSRDKKDVAGSGQIVHSGPAKSKTPSGEAVPAAGSRQGAGATSATDAAAARRTTPATDAATPRVKVAGPLKNTAPASASEKRAPYDRQEPATAGSGGINAAGYAIVPLNGRQPAAYHRPAGERMVSRSLILPADAGITEAADHLGMPVSSADTTSGNKEADTVQEKQEKHSGRPLDHWGIRLTAGPEWSMVEGRRAGAPGITRGIMLQYRFGRWYVESGALLASKIYSARPGDYHPPVNYYPTLRSVKANCLVLDVPVNLRYDVFRQNNQRLFVSGGLSSFWMKEEEYTYKYTQGGSLRSKDWSIYNQNHHLFSIANVALGYEKSWGHLSLQASPYIKLPLGGVGYGKVRLVSAGALFSVQYGF